jgi:rod shape-determining protein MreC
MKIRFKSRWTLLSAVLLIIIVLLLLQKFAFFVPIKNTTTSIFSPIQLFFKEFANQISSIGQYFRNNKLVFTENQQLKEQISKLTVENIQLKKDIDDITILQNEVAFIRNHQYQSVAAKIIGIASDTTAHVILINKGQNDGIRVGYPVIVNDGIFIGKIVEANSNMSKILLLSDNKSQVSAIIQNESKSPGIINGQYGLSLRMDLIPQDQNIAKDQLVTTSGHDQYIPQNLIIGKINSVTKKEGELFQQADIEPFLSYNNLSVVSILTSIQ